MLELPPRLERRAELARKEELAADITHETVSTAAPTDGDTTSTALTQESRGGPDAMSRIRAKVDSSFMTASKRQERAPEE